MCLTLAADRPVDLFKPLLRKHHYHFAVADPRLSSVSNHDAQTCASFQPKSGSSTFRSDNGKRTYISHEADHLSRRVEALGWRACGGEASITPTLARRSLTGTVGLTAPRNVM